MNDSQILGVLCALAAFVGFVASLIYWSYPRYDEDVAEAQAEADRAEAIAAARKRIEIAAGRHE